MDGFPVISHYKQKLPSGARPTCCPSHFGNNQRATWLIDVCRIKNKKAAEAAFLH
jgi:hypothetical protein